MSRRRNDLPATVDAAKIRSVEVSFDAKEHVPSDITLHLWSGDEIKVSAIEETRMGNTYRDDWLAFTGVFGKPVSLMVRVAIGGAS